MRVRSMARGGAAMSRKLVEENAELEHGSRVTPTIAIKHAVRDRDSLNNPTILVECRLLKPAFGSFAKPTDRKQPVETSSPRLQCRMGL